MLYFRFPFSDKICTVGGTAAETAVTFVSFDATEKLEFKGNLQQFSFEQFSALDLPTNFLEQRLPHEDEESESSYAQKISRVISFVNENKLPKLVISRRKKRRWWAQELDLKKTFLNLCSAFPNAFVYVFVNDGRGWLGAFSELLGRFSAEKKRFQTMSLAGTLPLDEEWTTKEIAEQQAVTDFIQNTLEKYARHVERSETQDHISGSIKHLRTDFSAEVQPEKLESLIADLHPTPAVCGMPKEICRKAIARFETHDRGLYAGYIRVQTEDDISWFVNLRCAELFSDGALLYVGGGITADSQPEKEWRETELKADALLKNLSFY